MRATKLLHNLGQSLWLDNITRDLLNTGTLKRFIDDLSITGLTSNPIIFDQAIKTSKAFVKSWDELLAMIASKSYALKKGDLHAICAS